MNEESIEGHHLFGENFDKFALVVWGAIFDEENRTRIRVENMLKEFDIGFSIELVLTLLIDEIAGEEFDSAEDLHAFAFS